MSDETPKILLGSSPAVVALMISQWFEVPLIAGFVVWLVADQTGSKPSLSSTPAHLGIATAIGLMVVLIAVALRGGRSRVIATSTRVVVANPYRRYEIAASQLRRVHWARHRMGLGSFVWFRVVAFETQPSSQGRRQLIHVMASLGSSQRRDRVVAYFQDLCSGFDVPCDLTSEP